MSKQKLSETRKGVRLRRRREDAFNTSLAMGPVIGWALFGAIPLILSLYLSFTELHTQEIGEAQWVGLQNYIQLLSEDGYRTRVWYAFMATLCCMISTPICIFLSLILANLLCKIKFMQRLFRTVFFVPYVCSASIIVIIFRMFYDSGSGMLNELLSWIGLQPLNWLTSSPFLFFVSMTVMNIWSGLAHNTLLCMAAISRVDKSYYEAADLDGASKTRQFFSITLPAITPTLSYIVTFAVIGAFQTMGPFLLAEGVYGCPYWMAGETEGVWVTVGYYIYTMMSVSPYKYGAGIASAAGWVLGLLVFAVTMLVLRLQKWWVNYDFA